ncbi:hypothetical protein QYE76_004718 [Lolium multiflorum]|uniref:Transcription repressor n=1 Tax=Lolium multiflorum TaxID=4521 RepID=A0AAD8RR80_LOLMU|nr:hypothetical protein QYE76_004718 [Lolium multiflorum]
MEMEGLEEDAKKRNMSKKKHARLHKSFRHFSKALKKLNGHGRPSANDNPSPASTSSFLSACMHPRTHSFSFPGGRQRHVDAHHCDNDDDALAAGFRSLRIGSTAVLDDDGEDGSSTQEDYDGIESEGGASPAMAATKAVVAGGSGGVAVVTFSVAPYEDFRRSMREMSDAHCARMEAAAPAVDWDFMEELLFCYLQLNDRVVHKDILRAFTDTVAALRRRRRAPKPKSRRTRRRQPKGDDGGNVDDVEEAVASS